MAARPHVLIDSSLFIALSYGRDQYHHRALEAERTILHKLHRLVVMPVLYEVFHVLRARTSHFQALNVVTSITITSQIVTPDSRDLLRAFELLAKYESARLDFTDATLMAVAERLNITKIATFDRRDFALVTPEHAPHWDLLPENL